MPHETFHYQSQKEVEDKAGELGISLPLAKDIARLKLPLKLKNHTIRNRLAIQPMEGCDGELDGSPGELTRRRYDRFAKSGAGLIWMEATAIVPEGRANPRQLLLNEKNISYFQALAESIKETAQTENGFKPLLILQATHSGRYCKPEGKPAPLIAYHSPILEENAPIGDERIISDDYLKSLPEYYEKTAILAEKAGFDGIDIKACHRYLINEMFSAYTRPGPYGGSFENRIRLFTEAIAAVKSAVSERFLVTTRMNLYDGFARPYGWGAAADGSIAPDMTEPIRLAELLNRKYEMELINFTIGNPYFNPHVNRPFDKGPYTPPEHPFCGIERMCRCISEVKRKVPGLKVVGSGFSYLRQFSANLAAGMIETGGADLAGFGREAFAYPEFAKELLQIGALSSSKCCIACSKCSELMRTGSTAGCVVRDSSVYFPIYQKAVLENPEDVAHKISGMEE